MAVASDINRLLQELATRIGFESLELDDEGALTLQIADEVELTILNSPDTDDIVLASPIDDVDFDEEEPVELLRVLMQANLYWQSTDGATLSLDGATDTIMLAKRLRVVEMSAQTLQDEIEGFVHVAEEWASAIRIGITDDEAAKTPTPSAATGLQV